jgi:hypothetical protein
MSDVSPARPATMTDEGFSDEDEYAIPSPIIF